MEQWKFANCAPKIEYSSHSPANALILERSKSLEELLPPSYSTISCVKSCGKVWSQRTTEISVVIATDTPLPETKKKNLDFLLETHSFGHQTLISLVKNLWRIQNINMDKITTFYRFSKQFPVWFPYFLKATMGIGYCKTAIQYFTTYYALNICKRKTSDQTKKTTRRISRDWTGFKNFKHFTVHCGEF